LRLALRQHGLSHGRAAPCRSRAGSTSSASGGRAHPYTVEARAGSRRFRPLPGNSRAPRRACGPRRAPSR